MKEALQGVTEARTMSDSTCHVTADLVATIVRVVGEVADSVRVAAINVADAQQTALNFVEVLEAAGVWADSERARQDEQDKNGEGAKEKGEEAEASSNEEEDEEKTPEQEREERWRLLKSINEEVLKLQGEMRQTVNQNPALLEAVAVGEKQMLFAQVAEVLESNRILVGRAWRARASSDEDSLAAVEEALDFIFAAAAWKKIAAPSFEARLLRLASLVDRLLLGQMLQDDFLNYCKALIGMSSRSEDAGIESGLIHRLQDAARELQAGFLLS
jgi:hypothetical protein